MPLSVRPKAYTLPSYSLTGDLIGFLRCGLQYRYTRIGNLPPSQPVQLWFGEFIHGVLDEAFRRYQDTVRNGNPVLPPWADAELDDIRALIKARLAARGLHAWNPDMEALGDQRARAAIQELGPYLFPLIHRSEVRLYGARLLPPIQSQYQFRLADRYEMVGIVDVVTHIAFNDPTLRDNPLIRLIRAQCPNLPHDGTYELIVDYKGMRRPANLGLVRGSYWDQYAWQIQTYAELRRKQADALKVVAGVLIYVNELYPSKSDMRDLKREVQGNLTDVPPAARSEAEQLLRSWSSHQDAPVLSLEYRLARALRVIPVDGKSVQDALANFDDVVRRIETCRGKELTGTPILQAWERNASDESTCVICDSRTFCPDYQSQYARGHGEMRPKLPGVKVKQ